MIRLVILLFSLPTIIIAEPIAIRSGEHDTFSRLVFSIEVGTPWTLTPSDDGFMLQLTDQSDGFDTTKVFNRIPRERLSDVTQIAPDTLQLSVSCSCDSDAFLWRPDRLVVDIIDGSESVSTLVIPVARAQITATQSPNATQLNVPLRLPNMLVLNDQITPQGPAAVQPMAPSTDLSATEAALAEGIARAASQGFLVPSIKDPVLPDPIEAPIPEEQALEPQSEYDQPILAGRPGVGITTALDRDLALLGTVLGRSIDQQCLSGDYFQIDAWGDDRAFHVQAAALAEALAGEFGEEPLEAQDELARLYIHFGFGVEARAVLAADPASSQTRTILAELAGIVDDYEGEYPRIKSQAGCATSGALWAFLINPTTQEIETRNQLIQHFFELPQPLRSQIAPRLARRFIEVDDPDAASQLLHAADNIDADTTHEVQSARALVLEEFDDSAGALNVLSKEASDSARTTPQSIIRLIELELEQGLQPSEENLLLAAALRQEHSDTPIAQDLADVEAKGWIAIGQYQVALDLVQNRNDVTALAITDSVFNEVTDRAEASTFLEFAYGDVPKGLSPETENAISRRLIDLGFSERATEFLKGPAEQEAASERRYLRAEAATGSRDFVLAIESLLGMTDDRARALRARAYEGLGAHRAALSALTTAQTASMPTLQFRAGAWERLIAEEDEVLSAFAEAILEPPNEDSVETLLDRRAILAQSQESRRAVEGLLLRFDGTTAQD